MDTSLSYCGTYCRNADPDRFFLSLLAPRAAHENLWALLAFNQEIAKTREVVTDTTIGLIRLLWWRDALSNLYAGNPAPKHEILEALEQAIRTRNLPQGLFETLLYAREFDVEDRAPATLEGMEAYAGFTNAPLLELCALVTGQGGAEEDLAIGYGLTGLLRAVVYHARQQRCYLPEELLATAELSPHKLYTLQAGTRLPVVIEAVGQAAAARLKKSRPSGPMAKGMKALAGLYLKQMKACGWNPLDPRWIAEPPFWQLRVAVSARL